MPYNNQAFDRHYISATYLREAEFWFLYATRGNASGSDRAFGEQRMWEYLLFWALYEATDN